MAALTKAERVRLTGQVLSDMSLDDWEGEWTMFNGFYDTRPAGEGHGGFAALVKATASQVALVADKAAAQYFVPCSLKDAPLVGNTLEKARKAGEPLSGKQRSSSHVTTATAIVVDIDGVPGTEFKALSQRLCKAGITALAYSSFSHGNPEKKGVRARLIVPVDGPLDGAEYRAAAAGLNELFLDGKADESGFKLHQQQGTWATNPEWAGKAFRGVELSGVARADVLIEAAPAQLKPNRPSDARHWRPPTGKPIDRKRVLEALVWLPADTNDQWVDIAYCLKAAFGDAGFLLWKAWAATPGQDFTKQNVGRHDPGTVWERLDPDMPAKAGVGKLLQLARDIAFAIVSREARRTAGRNDAAWGDEAAGALEYLHKHHPFFLRNNIGVSVNETY